MSKLQIPWKRLTDDAPDGLFVVDADGRVQYANLAALALLGLAVPDGAPVTEWLAHLDGPGRNLMLKAIADGDHIQLHLREAEHPHLALHTDPLEGGNGVLCRIRRDYEVEASEVIATLVHDLRKPMTSILGYAKMLLTVGGESSSDMQRQFLDTINRNVQRLNDNLAAVQDMTRVDRANLKLTLTPQLAAEVAGHVLDDLRPLIEEKGHNLTLDFPDDLPAARADGEYLEQIIHILLDNAVKYTPPGGQIRLQGHASEGLVQIDVVDNGVGISETEQKRLFTKFSRGEAELVNEYHGLGLNLYIARGLVQLQGGRLWYESGPDQGSTFSFTLPTNGAALGGQNDAE